MFELVYERLSPPSVLPGHQQIVICRIHFHLLNRTDQFTCLSDPLRTFNPPLSSLPSLVPPPLVPATPFPSLLRPQHVLRLWFRSGNDQRLSYVQSLQAQRRKVYCHPSSPSAFCRGLTFPSGVPISMMCARTVRFTRAMISYICAMQKVPQRPR